MDGAEDSCRSRKYWKCSPHSYKRCILSLKIRNKFKILVGGEGRGGRGGGDMNAWANQIKYPKIEYVELISSKN